MYLTKLVLNPMNWKARMDYSVPYEMHRTLSSLFDVEKPKILYRIEELGLRSTEMSVLLQSEHKPNLYALDRNYLLKDIPSKKLPSENELVEILKKQSHYYFHLTANPVKRIIKETLENNKTKNKKIPLYGEEDQVEWLLRQGNNYGFEILGLNIASFSFGRKNARIEFKEEEPESMTSKTKRNLFFHGVKYDGVLRVVDPESFLKGYFHGIGPSKAFGFGLLSIKKYV
jgi:CRISPR system Cascade subunit CasE